MRIVGCQQARYRLQQAARGRETEGRTEELKR